MPHAFDRELLPAVPSLPALDLADLDSLRTTMRKQWLDNAAPIPAGVSVETVWTGGQDGAGVELRVVRPTAVTGRTAGVVFAHGGGFVLGDVDNVALPAQWAADLGVVVVSVGYRLAPEHPYPAAFDDVYAALEWTASNAEGLRVDADRVAVAGMSAGAALAAACCIAARDRGGPAVCFQLLDIPVLDDRLGTVSMRTFTDTPLWNRAAAEQSWRMYLGADITGEVPDTAAPARAADLAGLPPAYISVCEFDPLRDEGLAFGQRLVAAGVPTELHLYPGTFHGSADAVPNAAVSRRMAAERSAALARGLRVSEEV